MSLETGTAVQVRSCSAQQNRSAGIDAGGRAVLVANTFSGNGFIGLNVFSGVVQGNTSSANAFTGIQAQSPTLSLDNMVNVNSDDGITRLSGCRIHGNISRDNGNFGLVMTSASAYSSNVVKSNTTGGVSGGANRGSNFCDGNGVVSSFCP